MDARDAITDGTVSGSVIGPKTIIKVGWEGFLSREGLVVTTPGVTMPTELITWVKSWAKVSRLAISDTDTIGATDYFGVAWEDSIDVDMFASTIIEMVCHYFGWDRSQVQFEGNWTEEEDEIDFARTALITDVPKLKVRVLALAAGLTYLLPGIQIEVQQGPEGAIVRVLSVSEAPNHQGAVVQGEISS